MEQNDKPHSDEPRENESNEGEAHEDGPTEEEVIAALTAGLAGLQGGGSEEELPDLDDPFIEPVEDGVLEGHTEGICCLLVHKRGSGPAPTEVVEDQDVCDGAMLYTGSIDTKICCWEMKGGKFALVGKLEGHQYAVNCLVMGDDDVLYSCSDDRLIKVWNTTSMKCAATIRGHEGGINFMVLHSTVLYSCDDEGKVRLWDTANGHATLLTLRAGSEAVNCMEFVQGGLWTGGDDGVLRRWVFPDEIESGSVIETDCSIAVADEFEGGCPGGIMINVLKGFNGELYAALGVNGGGGIIQHRNATTGVLLRMFASAEWSRSLIIDPHRIYSCCDDGTLLSWNQSTNQMYPVVEAHSAACMAMTRVNDTLLSAGDDKLIRTWRILTSDLQ